MKLQVKYLTLGCVGGMIYWCIEKLFRGYSHWTMILLDSVCFIALGLINEFLSWKTLLWIQMLIGAIIITMLEFIAGCIVNLWLNWNIWNYSNLPFNILGQICLSFSCIWYCLSAVGIILDDYLRYWIFDEEKPRYRLK